MLMLIDKGYYDYDFKAVEKTVDAVETMKDDGEVKSMLLRFGIGNAEKMQEQAMDD